MELKIDAQARALYLKIRDGRVHETRQLIDLQVLADFDDTGALLGLEVLDVPAQLDEFGYAHFDVAMTTSEGRVVKVKPGALEAAERASKGR